MENQDLSEKLDYSSDNKSYDNINENKIDFTILYNTFSSTVIKIHVTIISIIFSLLLSHNQTKVNKNLKDDEIDINNYYLGLLYIIILIFSFFRGITSYYTLLKDYEEIKTEEFLKPNFLKSKKNYFKFKWEK